MSHPYALVIATPEGPRSKENPNNVLIGPDSKYPDALAQQYDPNYGPNVIAGKYTSHDLPWLTPQQMHNFAYIIRAGLFTPDEVLKMAEAIRPEA